jgi:hypothetical protein
MTELFAEIDPTSAPANIKGWLECLFWFFGLIGALLYISKQVRGEKPHPPNESLGQSQEQLTERIENLEQWRGDLTEKMEMDKQTILLSGSQRGQRIYEKIDGEVKSLRQEMKEMNKDLTDKCEAIPAEVITLLKNTGAI